MTQTNSITQNLLTFIEKSPSCFHAVKNISDELRENGFTALSEGEKWNLQPGGKYFTTRNSSSIIAWTIPDFDFEGFSICASHSDSPSFKIKENESITSEKHYIKLNVEKYGGMLCAPWFDRPLSVAGRIIVESISDGKTKLEQKLVDVDRDLLMIPNLAIHMNRDANDGQKYNVQNDMLPIFSFDENSEPDRNSFMETVAQSAGVKRESIVSTDLFLYNRDGGKFWGNKNEFIASTKLDDLECAYTCLQGFIASAKDGNKSRNVSVNCIFDNEEVGSQTRQGAASTFLYDTLQRINMACKRSDEEYYTAIAKSFMISADNAHAVHPNHSDKSDPTNRPLVNMGPVIKFNAAQKYTTDSISAAIFKSVCKKAGVPYQVFTNRSDMAGGSTLGNISGTKVSIPTVDIGLAQWAMHSPYESAGSKDPEYMKSAIEEFYRLESIVHFD